MPTVDEIREWAGRDAIGSDDSKIGKIDHLYVDRETGEPTFAAIRTGLFGTNDTLVPVEGAQTHGDHVHVAWDKDKVKDAPNVEADGELSETEEAKLYEHYGIVASAEQEGATGKRRLRKDVVTTTDQGTDRH
ncbi:MAG: PRC-barrel domain-containing protein [Solirubrobacterales bacterium]|nr:PRC-barrel domain-containing protein [Solirubrobacterales bacterium]